MLGALVAGGASLLGGFLANRGRSAEAQKSRNFQEKMSSTSWQRGVQDMQAAGLNPALAYGSGGASSPGGATASQEDVVSPSVGSAMQAKRLKADLKLIKEQTTKTKNEGVAAVEKANVDRTQAFWNIKREMNEEMQFKFLNLQLPWAQSQSRAASRWGNPAAAMQLLLNSGGSQAAGLFGGGLLGKAFLKRGR